MSDPKNINRDTLLSDNRTDGERALEQATKKLVSSENFFDWLISPQLTQPQLLPLMAQEECVTDWFSSDSEAAQRESVSIATTIHQKAGTRPGLFRALKALDVNAEVKKGAKPYSLDISAEIESGTLNQDLESRLVTRVNNHKSERDSISIELVRSATINQSVGVLFETNVLSDCEPYGFSGINSELKHYTACLFETHIYSDSKAAQ